MDIYVVQPGDNIYSIANSYGVSVTKLIQDNGLNNPNSLVPGQAIVIAYPSQTYTVREGDTLANIANNHGVSIMQLLRNNTFLSDREYLYPGELLVISYNTNGKVTTNGYAYPFIDRNTLIKTLPSLTYISVFNYRVAETGEIVSYDDDAQIIQLAKDYGVVPLLMASSISPQGEPNLKALYDILLNKEYHNRLINNYLKILKSTGYYGLNIMMSGISTINQKLFIDLLTDLSGYLKNEGYQLYITINPYIKYSDNEISFERLDYTSISQLVDGIIFLEYVWGTNYGPPSPVTSVNLIGDLIKYVVSLAPPNKIDIGKPLVGYDWGLPYIPSKSYAYSLTLDSVLTLADNARATIQFDEESKTPFFRYTNYAISGPIEHIVWFIDARSIDLLDKLVAEYGLLGSSVWNIMTFNQQVWTLINSQYEIIKNIPDNLK